MAICKMCHKTIPDGLDFCPECEEKRANQADESYLDSLLSSVTADLTNYSEASFENISRHIAPKMKNNEAASSAEETGGAVSDVNDEAIPESEVVVEPVNEPEVPADISEDIAIEDNSVEDNAVEDNAVDNIASSDIVSEEISSDDISFDDISSDEIPSDDIPSDDIPTDITEDITNLDISADEIPAADISLEDVPTEDVPEENISLDEISTEDIPAEESISDDIISDLSTDATEDIISAISEDDNLISADDSLITEEIPEDDSSDVDELLDSLLADMDKAGAGEPEPEPEKIDPDDLSDIFAAAESEHTEGSEEPVEELTDEMIQEINSEASADDSSEPAVDITDITADTAEPAADTQTESDIEEISTEGLPGIEEIDFSSDAIDSTKIDIEDVSIDTLSNGASVVPDTPAVGSTEFLGEEELENSDLPDVDDSALEPIGDFDVDALLNDIDDGSIDKNIDELNADKQKKKPKKEKTKKTLFQRLFANVEEDPAVIAKREAKEKADAEAKKLHEENQKKRKEASKEEKEAAKAEKAVQKEEEAKKKAELKRQKQEEAKEKARKKKEERLALEEFEANEGRINRAGATILFVIFAILTVFIIVGTNIYSYNLSIKRAEDEFEIKHYNDAYYEVYGLKIQDEDIELYDKIMTVMYVNTQLNAYEYYMTSNNRDKALDSLLKGLQRYDKYLDLAELLGIRDDLNYVKTNILMELSSEFNIDEYEALQMVELRDEVDYSEYIYTLLGTYEGYVGN